MLPPPATRRLYRSLLRTSFRFTQCIKNGKILSSLLHRTGIEDYFLDIDSCIKQKQPSGVGEGTEKNKVSPTSENTRLSANDARDLTLGYRELQKMKFSFDEQSQHFSATSSLSNTPAFERLFRKLLKEICGGKGTLMRFPSQIPENSKINPATNRSTKGLCLDDIIRREFRSSSIPTKGVVSSFFNERDRVKVAFIALRELSKKLKFVEEGSKSPVKNKNSEVIEDDNKYAKKLASLAKDVQALPAYPPSSYLQPGTYLVAHPLIDGYFSKTVIVLLDHTDTDSDDGHGGTYGLVLNKNISGLNGNGSATLKDVVREECVSIDTMSVFGDSVVSHGGPVQDTIQMLYSCSPALDKRLGLGGKVLPWNKSLENTENDEGTNDTINPDVGVFYSGNMLQVSQSILDSDISKTDCSFFVGASVWADGQLESEIDKGWWMPCTGPPDAALRGTILKLLHGSDSDKNENMVFTEELNNAVWQSMMSAIGGEEARLANIMTNIELDENSGACDNLDS
mmetsp:Transcript_49760/g.59872  ORF Transcript_49760/g.59872 Transcript_49760/m.59872 type:complete len:512 (+) Transcript_49760:34-1569(+)